MPVQLDDRRPKMGTGFASWRAGFSSHANTYPFVASLAARHFDAYKLAPGHCVFRDQHIGAKPSKFISYYSLVGNGLIEFSCRFFLVIGIQ